MTNKPSTAAPSPDATGLAPDPRGGAASLSPIELEIAIVNLPDDIAEFGIVEKLQLPGDLIDQLHVQGPAFRAMVAAAIQQNMAQVAWSLATSLLNVLAYRAETGAPATHNGYIEWATAAAEQAREAQKVAQEEARAAAKAVAGDGGGTPV